MNNNYFLKFSEKHVGSWTPFFPPFFEKMCMIAWVKTVSITPLPGREFRVISTCCWLLNFKHNYIVKHFQYSSILNYFDRSTKNDNARKTSTSSCCVSHVLLKPSASFLFIGITTLFTFCLSCNDCVAQGSQWCIPPLRKDASFNTVSNMSFQIQFKWRLHSSIDDFRNALQVSPVRI